MENFAQPEELSIATLFKSNNYIIPIYQRSYAWGKDEIEQLITDISDSSGRYYLGSLIVDKIDSNLYSVIDGQQRLTTIFLLLSFIKPQLISQSSLKFEAREKSNRTLSELWLNATPNILKDRSLYSEEILYGRNIIETYFQNKDDNFKKTLCNRFEDILIIRTQVPKNIDLNHYFEIMNTRGEQLEIHEIAKGRMLSAIEDKNDRNIAAIIWDACSKMDSYIQMNFDKESRKNVFGALWDNFLPIDFRDISKRIKEGNLSTEKRFSLQEQLEQLNIATKDDNPDEQEENERFEPIVSFRNFLLLVNEAIANSGNEDDSSLDDKKFIESLKCHWSSSEKATNFIFNLIKMRFLFDKYVIKREYAKDYKEEGKWSLQKLEIYHDVNRNQEKPQYNLTYGDSDQNKTATLRLLQSALRITYTSPKTMHWISKVLAALTVNQDADLIGLLERYACLKVKEADYKNAKGFGIDRIVFSYLDYVLERNGKSGIMNFQFQYRTSIEHFYPQTPIDIACWEEKYLHNFGNLALITVKANSKFSNLSPQSKADTYPETIKQSPKLNIMTQQMRINNGWTQELVLKHEAEMFHILDNELSRYGMFIPDGNDYR